MRLWNYITENTFYIWKNLFNFLIFLFSPLIFWQYTSSWDPPCWGSFSLVSCLWLRRPGKLSSLLPWVPSFSRPYSRSCCGTFSFGPQTLTWSLQFRGVESFTISTINLSIHGSNKRFFDKLYEGSRLNQANMLLVLRNNYYIVLICSFVSITGNILQQ